ncbi:CASTOR/POLLUX-related putative ion channel [Actinocorallia populi]|uniref:CASTOR/POLLUX-related putative ion channel n=1 Tax=Actinocorallia populi TaxID=2079200 RepID=UPI000D0912A5|nr:potassium transporter TrkA [Actinocorallia populi]
MAWWRARARYWFDNTMARGTPALIGWLGLASALLVLAVASLAVLIAPRDAAEQGSWSGVVWRSLLRTLDPGVMGDDEGTASYLALMLASTVGGIFIVSSLISVLTTGLNNRLTRLRKGRSRIVEHGHTVLLGWSDQVFTVLEELIEADHSGRRSCIAILADLDKGDMDEAIRIKIGRTGRIRIVCRRGNPLKVADLALVSPATARSVIVLAPQTDEPDIDVIKVLLSLNAQPWRETRPPIVAPVRTAANMPAALLAGGEHARIVDADDIAVRLIVQSHRQCGLSAVCAELLDFQGHELYLHPEPSLAGSTFADALHAFERGVPVGLWHPDGSLTLNPASRTVVGHDDELIMLAEDDELIGLADRRPHIAEEAISGLPVTLPEPGSTLILGWNPRAPKIIERLDGCARPGSQLLVAALRDDDPRERLPRLANTTVSFTRCDDTARTDLEALDVRSHHSVIVLADESHDPQRADARTLVTLLHLRDLAPYGDRPFSVIVELRDDANREIAQITQAEDLIVSDKLITQVMTQLSESPRLHQVFTALLHPEGPEIYLKPATGYLRPGAPATFATLLEAARRRGETALGYRRRSRFHEPPGYGIVLNPDRRAPLTLTEDDLVIVLAGR